MTVCGSVPCILVLAVAQLKALCSLHCVLLDTTVLRDGLWDGSFLVQLAPCRVSREPPALRPACLALLVWSWYILWVFYPFLFYFPVFLNMLLSPAGMFCSYPGLSQPTGLCQAGFYCAAGSTGPNATSHQVFFSFTITLLFFFMLCVCSLGVNHKKLFDLTFFLSPETLGDTFTRSNLMSSATKNIHLFPPSIFLNYLHSLIRHWWWTTLPEAQPSWLVTPGTHSNVGFAANFIEPISHLQLSYPIALLQHSRRDYNVTQTWHMT